MTGVEGFSRLPGLVAMEWAQNKLYSIILMHFRTDFCEDN